MCVEELKIINTSKKILLLLKINTPGVLTQNQLM